MKLLFFNGNIMEKIGEEYYSIYSWNRFPQMLADHGDAVTLWAPVTLRDGNVQPSPGSWKIKTENLRVEDFDPFDSFVGFYRQWPRQIFKWRKITDRLVEEHDVVVIRLPSPMVALITQSAERKRKPLVFIVAGNIESQSDRIIAGRGLRKFVAKTIIRQIVRQQLRCSRLATLIYAHGHEVGKGFEEINQCVKNFRTPHVCREDFLWRKDTCLNNEVRILRVCWIKPSKGIEFLLEAVALLKRRGLRVHLEIAGKTRDEVNHEEVYEEHLKRRVQELGIDENVTFLGWIPFDKIHEVYARNDIQVISSLADSFPRSITEGSARGLPLVCTEVGGCPDELSHGENAFLVEPGNSGVMADIVEKLIRDGTRRRKIIRGGYDMAQRFSFEELGMEFLNDVREIART